MGLAEVSLPSQGICFMELAGSPSRITTPAPLYLQWKMLLKNIVQPMQKMIFFLV